MTSIATLARQYRQGETSPVAVTRLLLERITRLNDRLHAFITVADARALADARAAERRLRAGDPSPLLGIPIAVKDNIATAGLRTTGNSRVLAEWIPEHDAAVVARLASAGAVVIGKTNLNEFGWSIPSDDDLCPPPRNPWNPDCAAVGSSSGSGVAVSAGLAIAALGTDSGGSVRLPAGQMGLIGCKPTHALVSPDGVLHAGSIGEVGVLTRTAADAAIMLDVMSGGDASDPNAGARAMATDARGFQEGIHGMHIGVPWHTIDSVPVETEIRAAFEATLSALTHLGATVRRVDLPGLEAARAANFIVLNAELYAAHETRLRSQWQQYGRSARMYLAQGAFVSAADYLQAQEVGRLVSRAVDDLFRNVDLLAMPTSPVVTAEAARRPEAHRRGINASFTAPFNLTGHPAVSVPCGVSRVGLPIGLQLVGRRHDEATLLRVAGTYEQASGWHALRPPEAVIAGGSAW